VSPTAIPVRFLVTGPDSPLTASVSRAMLALESHPAATGAKPRGAIHVQVHDGSLDDLRAANRSLRRAGLTCLVVREEVGTAVIGPWLLPGRPGCHECLLARQEAALLGDRAAVGILRQLERGPCTPGGAGWAAGPARHLVAAMVAAEVAALTFGGTPQAVEAVLSVALDSLEGRRHRFVPHPHCSSCGGLEPDSAEAAVIELTPRPKAHPRQYHAVDLAAGLESLEEACVDAGCGLLTGWWTPGPDDEQSFLPMMTASVAAGRRGANGHGRAIDYRSARVVAVCEGLERYGGLAPMARRTVVRASFDDLGPTAAIDPRRFGLPSPGPAEPSPDQVTRYSPSLVMSWVWAFSFGLGRPALVPEQLAYYGPSTPAPERFVVETSNGCALGGNLEEAILHGILEVAERDAFLVTWHARLPAPRLDLASVRDTTTRLLIDRFERVSGYRLRAFDITLPHAPPCFWLMAVDEADDETRPRAACSAGSSLDPEKGILSALVELVTMMPHQRRSYAGERERALGMLAAPDLVTRMEDHPLLNGLPEAWPRFEFLGQTSRSLAEAFPGHREREGELDLTRELRGLIDSYLEHGLDVLVVNQTSIEQRRVGMHCVKVLIPGTLPMTFGHRNRRLAGLDRLRSLPVLMGHRSTPLADADVCQHPHPFP
jgi:ribosomal protein S12 methylthiotransferase accessory factor